MKPGETRIALADVRRAPRYWRSLDERASRPEFLERVEREFPAAASELVDPVDRRDFLRVMGASIALAGITGCTRQPEEKIVPYVKAPEDLVPGRPLYFATAALHAGYASGILVESHLGRPTKVEGNPEHPASRGGSDLFAQASILGLYDPDRSQTLMQRGEIRSWGEFLPAVKTAVDAQKPLKGAGFRILTETVTSPALGTQIEALLAEYPEARWHVYEAAGRDNVNAGALLAFGEPAEPLYRFEQADVVLSLDADFIGAEPGRVRYIRDHAARRKLNGPMNRLYAVESAPSLTGAVADHRLPLKPSEVEGFARAVAAALGIAAEGAVEHAWVAPLVDDLKAHAGRSLVVAGAWQPPAVHALAHAINQRLGNAGKTVVYTAPVAARSEDGVQSIRDLTADMEAGKVDLLLILGGNPAYTAPADVEFVKKMEKVGLRIHLSLYEDETSDLCHWHVPETHPLETWGDARAYDGTVTILQPLVAPLYPSCRSAHEVLAAFTSRPERTGYQILRDHWQGRLKGLDFESVWRRWVHDGVVAGTALPEKAVQVKPGDWTRAPDPVSGGGLEVAFRPDPCVWDGRYANNGWLQELPRPLTRITWDNAVLMGPKTSESLGLGPAPMTATGTYVDVVKLQYKGRTLEAPAWVVPGHPEGSVTLHLGYGRRRAGRVGSGVGFDAGQLRTSAAFWGGAGLELRRTTERYQVASTQDHWSIAQESDREAKERHIVRSVTVEELEKEPKAIQEMGEEAPTDAQGFYPPYDYERKGADGKPTIARWGMVIDTSACVGCNACVVACVSENNIPVVGKDQVARGREMHWIRIDRYWSGDPGRPESVAVHHQPVLCMQCEQAPCEVVCPVAATVHSDEGLNDMVYNRCVGTRYCSNNCPYKVRRFNFFLYQDWEKPTLKMMRNPDVTVRSRGVMEKCTYCVQRINHARIDSRREGRKIKDGELLTACQQACPAQAITFGDLNDPDSQVARAKASNRDFGLLAELGTRPRTSYLGEVKNPNPALGGAAHGAEKHHG